RASCDFPAQPAQGLLARHHVQMIEHAAPRLANRQQLDELALGAAREPVGEERRTLRRLLRHRGEPVEHASGRERVEPLADRRTHGRDPSAPAEPPAPSTIRPPATATAAVKAPPSSSRTKDVAESGRPKRRAWSTTASATAHTLSAVPMSTRFTLRCAGTVGRWSTPGVS